MSERGLGGENTKLSRERSREMRTGLRWTFIQKVSKSRQIEVSRGVETSIEEGVKKNNVDRCSCQEGVEEQSKDTRKEAQLIDQLMIHLLSRICQDCDKKKLKSLTESQVLTRCRDCLKIVFQEGKNTDMNAIKHATQPRIQSTF